MTLAAVTGELSSTRGLRVCSPRDQRILARALGKVGAGASFAESIRALGEAVAESIPAGRIFFLGERWSAGLSREGLTPVIGSLVSGVGLSVGDNGETLVVRREEGAGRWKTIGSFAR